MVDDVRRAEVTADLSVIRRAEVHVAIGNENSKQHWKAETLSQSTFTNTSYETKKTLSFKTQASGDYLIVVTSEIGCSFPGSVWFRARFDGTTIMETHHDPYGDTTNFPTGTFYLAESLAAGNHRVDIDAYRGGAGGTAHTKNLRINVIRLDHLMPTTGMYDYSNTEAQTSISSVWVAKETLTFTPDVEGEYLVLATCQLDQPVDYYTMLCRINYDSASEYLPILSPQGGNNTYIGYERPTGTYNTYLWGGLITIPASSKTITLESAESAGTTGNIAYRRLIAIRLGALDADYESDEDTTELSTTSTSYVDRSSITLSVPGTSDYLIIGSIGTFNSSLSYGTGMGIYHDTVEYLGDADFDTKDSLTPGDTVPGTVVAWKSLGLGSHTFKTQYKRIDGGTCYTRASFITASRLPAGDIRRAKVRVVPEPQDHMRRAEVSPAVTAEPTRRAKVFVFRRFSYWHASHAVEQSFTSEFSDALKLRFNAPAQGDYLVIATGEAMATGGGFNLRIQLDDTTDITTDFYPEWDTGTYDDYHPFSSFRLFENLASGSHWVDIDFYETGNGTGYCRNLHIVVLRLDDVLTTSGMYDYAATEGAVELTGSWATYCTLTFTPDQAGDYLILGNAEISWDFYETDEVEIRLNYDSGSEYLPISTAGFIQRIPANDNEMHDLVWGGIVNIPASSKTILMEAKESGSAYGSVRCRRIFAIRLDALQANMVWDEDTARGGTSGTSWVARSACSFTPYRGGDYLILGSLVTNTNTIGEPAEAKIEHFSGTNAPEDFQQTGYYVRDATDPADWLPTTTVHVKALENSSQTFRNLMRTDDGGYTCYAKGSFILAFHLDDAHVDLTRRAELEVATTADITRRAEVEVLQYIVDITRRAEMEVSSTTVVDDIRRAEVSPLEVVDDTREASVSPIVTKESTRRGEVQVTEVPDLTRRAVLDVLQYLVDITRRAEVHVQEVDDLTRRAVVGALEVAEPARRGEVQVTEVPEPTRRSVVTVTAGYTLSGVTKDDAGSPEGSCDVYLIKDNLDNTITWKDHVVSHATTGAYEFISIADNDAQYMVVAFKDGSPNLMDVTDHVLQPS